MSPRLQLQLERDRYAPGDTVRGTILVLEGGGSRSLEALLEYNEKTADYREVAISISSGPLHAGDLTTGTSFDFELALPPDALPNYGSANGELYWQVNAKSDEFGRDTHESSRIQVAPPGGAGAGEGFGTTAPSQPQIEQASQIGFGRGSAPKTFLKAAGGGRWFWRLLFAAGVVFFIAGVVILVRTVQFVAGAEHATGTVVDLSREIDDEGDETFYPVVRFTTAEGQEIEFVSSSGSSPPSESPGDRVDVLYDPDDPSDAKLSGFFHLWLFPGLFFLFGAAFFAIAWFLRWLLRRPTAVDVERLPAQA